MKKRAAYFWIFLGLLAVEILIGAFVHDRFIRPYMGDVLVTMLLCCLGRTLFSRDFSWLSAAVFGFSVIVECSQCIDIPALEGTLLGIILGSTFDWADILCYGIGCLVFSAAEYILCHKKAA